MAIVRSLAQAKPLQIVASALVGTWTKPRQCRTFAS